MSLEHAGNGVNSGVHPKALPCCEVDGFGHKSENTYIPVKKEWVAFKIRVGSARVRGPVTIEDTSSEEGAKSSEDSSCYSESDEEVLAPPTNKKTALKPETPSPPTGAAAASEAEHFAVVPEKEERKHNEAIMDADETTNEETNGYSSTSYMSAWA